MKNYLVIIIIVVIFTIFIGGTIYEKNKEDKNKDNKSKSILECSCNRDDNSFVILDRWSIPNITLKDPFSFNIINNNDTVPKLRLGEYGYYDMIIHPKSNTVTGVMLMVLELDHKENISEVYVTEDGRAAIKEVVVPCIYMSNWKHNSFAKAYLIPNMRVNTTYKQKVLTINLQPSASKSYSNSLVKITMYGTQIFEDAGELSYYMVEDKNCIPRYVWKTENYFYVGE